MTILCLTGLPRLSLLVFLGGTLLTGCSNPEKTGRYLLDPPTAGMRVPNRIGSAELKDVSLPAYAADQEVFFQTADGALHSNPKILWADTPERAFTITLARAIEDVSGAVVIGEPWPLAEPPARQIEVRVERALAQANQTYRLSGRYFVFDDGLSGKGANHARSFDIVVPMSAQGPAPTATAASQAIALLAQQIASLSGPGQTITTRTSSLRQPAQGEDKLSADAMFNLPPLFGS